MFKSICNSLFIFTAMSSCVAASVDLPDQFTVTERVFTVMATFDIESPRYRLGYAQRAFSVVPEYVLYDYQNNPQASARMRWTLFGATFDIADATGKKIGTVDERIFTLFPTFDIISPEGKKLATARMNFLGTEYTVRDPETSEVIATISRLFFNFFGDTWTVNVTNHGLLKRNDIDPSEFVLIAVFQTNREYWEQVRREEEENRRSYKVAHHSEVTTAVSEQIEAFQGDFDGVEPTEADYQAVEEVVQAMFHDEGGLAPSSGRDGLLSDLSQVSQLLTDDSLTIGEKSALNRVLQQKLSNLP